MKTHPLDFGWNEMFDQDCPDFTPIYLIPDTQLFSWQRKYFFDQRLRRFCRMRISALIYSFAFQNFYIPWRTEIFFRPTSLCKFCAVKCAQFPTEKLKMRFYKTAHIIFISNFVTQKADKLTKLSIIYRIIFYGQLRPQVAKQKQVSGIRAMSGIRQIPLYTVL